jgi:ammonia channel protein AmtB
VLASGALEGNRHQLVNQAIGVGIAAGLAVVGTLVILKVVDVVIGLRVPEDHEIQGLDVTQHGEEGYSWEHPAPAAAFVQVAKHGVEIHPEIARIDRQAAMGD